MIDIKFLLAVVQDNGDLNYLEIFGFISSGFYIDNSEFQLEGFRDLLLKY